MPRPVPSKRITVLLIAVVGILILTAAAASITEPTGTGDGFGPPADWLDDPDDDGGIGIPDDNGANGGSLMPPGGVLCFPVLFQLNVQLLLIGLVALVGGIIWWRENFVVAAAILGGTLPLFITVYLALLAACRVDSDTDEAFDGGIFGIAREASNETVGPAIEATTDPLVLILILAAIGLLAVGLVVLRDDIDGRDPPTFEEAAEEEPIEQAAIAHIAGKAARRLDSQDLDGADIDNEIYRAWLEMTQLLELDNHETATPGEFADEAVDVGMDPDDVGALTELFESVRYGGHPATAQREETAIQVLRRIERTYGDDG